MPAKPAPTMTTWGRAGVGVGADGWAKAVDSLTIQDAGNRAQVTEEDSQSRPSQTPADATRTPGG